MCPERSALGMRPFPRLAYMEVGKGCEPFVLLPSVKFMGKQAINEGRP